MQRFVVLLPLTKYLLGLEFFGLSLFLETHSLYHFFLQTPHTTVLFNLFAAAEPSANVCVARGP